MWTRVPKRIILGSSCSSSRRRGGSGVETFPSAENLFRETVEKYCDDDEIVMSLYYFQGLGNGGHVGGMNVCSDGDNSGRLNYAIEEAEKIFNR